jgi:hypothetical protein
MGVVGVVELGGLGGVGREEEAASMTVEQTEDKAKDKGDVSRAWHSNSRSSSPPRLRRNRGRHKDAHWAAVESMSAAAAAAEEEEEEEEESH